MDGFLAACGATSKSSDASAKPSHGSQPRILVIGATNRPGAVDRALRRAGRFDREVVINPPSVSERRDLLASLLPAGKFSFDRREEEMDSHALGIEVIAKRMIGFVNADVAAFARSLILSSLSADACAPEAPHGVSSEEAVAAGDSHAILSQELIEKAFRETSPSMVREHRVKVEENITWESVGGLDAVKRRIIEAVEWPAMHPDAFARMAIRPVKGILLVGPPGCSKSTIAKVCAAPLPTRAQPPSCLQWRAHLLLSHAMHSLTVQILANSGSFAFYSLSGAALFSAFVGESERILRSTFASARLTKPSLLFIDEIDAIVGKRSSAAAGDVVQERILSTLLNEMDGIENLSSVTLLGATNRLDAIDGALLRPGRFDLIIEVGLPSYEERLQILAVLARGRPVDSCVNFEEVARRTEGYSGADLKNVIQEAAMRAIAGERLSISPKDIVIHPSHSSS